MAKPSDMDLMLYFDGELSPDEEAEVRAALADADGDDESALKLQAIEQIGETVRTKLELDTDDTDHRLGADLWELVERRMHANGEAEKAVPAAARPRVQAESSGGVWAAIQGWFGSHRGHVMTSVVTAGAVALLIMVFRPPTEKIVEKPGPERIVQVPAESVTPVVPVANEPAAVEELNVNEGTGYILTIPGEDGDSDTTVIWIEPEESMEGPI